MLYTEMKGIKWNFILIRMYRRMSLWYQDKGRCLKKQTMIELIVRFDNIQILKPFTAITKDSTIREKHALDRRENIYSAYSWQRFNRQKRKPKEHI